MTLRTGKNQIKSVEAPRPRAFTLIELILVMALLVIVIAVAAPSLSRFMRGRTLDSEARRFVSLTRYGQSRAVSEGVPVVLWINTRQGSYGLRQEAGYTEQDAKAVDFLLGKDLRVEVASLPAQLGPLAQARATRQTDPNTPMLRFPPDGFIDETSPQSVVLRDQSGESIWITQSRNRLNYEIHTNVLRNATR
jgi:type II secretion system protein H